MVVVHFYPTEIARKCTWEFSAVNDLLAHLESEISNEK